MEQMATDDGPPPITSRYPQYAETPMPGNAESAGSESDEEYDIRSDQTSPFYKNAMFVCIIGIFISHLWSMWTLSADVNILMAYQTEHAEQYKHIARLLENMHQVKWQMVPTS